MQPPQISWPDEPRMLYDHAHHVVVAGENLYFGSSAECGVFAHDTATGSRKWSFYTGAPVRFAPVVWSDRVFAASDDGQFDGFIANTEFCDFIHRSLLD